MNTALQYNVNPELQYSEELHNLTQAPAVTLKYTHYLSNSPDIVNTLAQACLHRNARIQLVAACGAGKTNMMLKCLAQRLANIRQIILAVPNRVQAEQNETFGFMHPTGYINTVSVTANGGDFRLDGITPYSAVYDSAARLLDVSEEDLSKTVLVIDEAHLLIGAQSYREKCINSLYALEAKICAAGGSVVHMTGTPAKLVGFSYTHRFFCQKTDANGNTISPFTFKRLELLIKKSKNVSMRDSLFSWICDCCQAGKVPLVRYNNKKEIHYLKSSLDALSIKTEILTADEKDYYMMSETMHYDSEVYKNLIENSALPPADVYLVTSILECGTSIESIIDLDGQHSTPDNIVPVYVVDRKKQCDLDNIQQFFSRVRFPIKETVVLLNTYQNKKPQFPGSTVAARGKSNYYQAITSSYLFNSAGSYSRNTLPTIYDKREDFGIIKRNGSWSPDISQTEAKAVTDYYMSLYYDQGSLRRQLEKSFGLDVTVHRITSNNRGKGRYGNKVPKEAIEYVKSVLNTPTFRNALTNPEYLDLDSEMIKKSKILGGSYLLRAMRMLSVSSLFSWNDILDYGIRRTENPDVAIIHNGKTLKKPEQAALDHVFLDISCWSDQYATIKMNQIKDNNLRTDTKMSPHDKFSFLLLSQGEKFELFVRMRELSIGNIAWKRLCEYASSHTVKELNNFVRCLHFTAMNRDLEPGTTEYFREVGYTRSVAGAEYHLVRNPEWIAEFNSGIHDKRLTIEICERIKDEFGHQVHKMTGKRSSRYTAEGIMTLFKDVYTCKRVRNKDPKEAVRLQSLRVKQSSLITREEHEKKIIGQRVHSFIDGAPFMDSESKKEAFDQIKNILRDNYSRKKANDLEHIIARWAGLSDQANALNGDDTELLAYSYDQLLRLI